MSCTAPFPTLLTRTVLALLVPLAVACSDDPVNGGADPDPDPGEALQMSGDVSSYSEGAAGELYSMGDNVSDLALGELDADGSFWFELLPQGDIEGDLEPATDDGGFGSDGFYNFVCIDEAIDGVDPDARFTEVRNVQFLATRADGSNYPRAIELSTRTEGQGRTAGQPFPGVWEDIHVYWIFADRDVEVQATCDEGAEVDLALTAGWNEVILDHRDRDAVRQYTGQRPADVDWYMDPEDG
ncbi:MAG: hypothetical protein EA352_08180 [Gemmatimonadales bacterium]|nr:MAG: hypothetical protein EA352_08180 [Gemmatimonadales bacterium]